jgi:phosphatidate cytidylyltransferase
MLERAISGAVFVGIVLGAIWYGPYTLWILMTIVALGCLWEFQKLLFDQNDAHLGLRRFLQIGLAALFCFVFFYHMASAHHTDSSYQFQYTNWQGVWQIAVGLIWLGLTLELFLKHSNPFGQMAIWVFGLVYCLFPVLMYSQIAGGIADYLAIIALAPFLLIWTNDTMAYLTGRAIGRTPFFPRISPKKTWEGTIGGVAFTVILAAFIGPKLGGWSQSGWMLAATIVGIFGTLGDLVESMLKRSVGVKDSGNIMPGHGGFLDRFDSFIFAAPFLWVVAPYLK